jgi:uncharacterized membrane protein YczE
MSGGRAWLFYVGIVLAVLGLALLLLAQAALGFYLGSALTIVGLILFGIGLRARLKASFPAMPGGDGAGRRWWGLWGRGIMRPGC